MRFRHCKYIPSQWVQINKSNRIHLGGIGHSIVVPRRISKVLFQADECSYVTPPSTTRLYEARPLILSIGSNAVKIGKQ